MAAEAAADAVTSSSAVGDISNGTASSVFDRHSWVGLLAVHGQTALQVSGYLFSFLLRPNHRCKKRFFNVFRLEALALSVIATATWLAGWVAVCHSRYCIKTTKRI